jgi:hypothetical protein
MRQEGRQATVQQAAEQAGTKASYMLITDKMKSYATAKRGIMPGVIGSTRASTTGRRIPIPMRPIVPRNRDVVSRIVWVEEV